MAFTEFYCQSGGSNLNAGSTTGNSAAYTSTSGNWNGTSTFTPTDGSTPANSVSAGDYASVYNDGASTAVYIARVTTVAAGVNGVITLSTTAAAGTAPTSNATARSIKTGGAWKGPTGSDGSPAFKFAFASLRNTTNDVCRCNLKNDATYSITATTTQTSVGAPAVYQGYTSAVGDGGQAVIDGGTSGTSYVLWTIEVRAIVINVTFQNNGATASANGVAAAVDQTTFIRCVFHDFRGSGCAVTSASNDTVFIECEAYNCNASNTSALGGFSSTTAFKAINCIAHDNAGSNSSGFIGAGGSYFLNCIADTNGAVGFTYAGTNSQIPFALYQCDAYNNTSDGLKSGASVSQDAFMIVRNCNFVKNGGYGINGASSRTVQGLIDNCGFGAGTQANSSGDTNALGFIFVNGDIDYASGVTPWQDPANGDFRIALAAARNTGRGAFTQTQGSYTGTVAYPDIGAAQHSGTAPVNLNPTVGFTFG